MQDAGECGGAVGTGTGVTAAATFTNGAASDVLCERSLLFLQGRSPFQHLVYPLPFDGGLGIHATNDLSGAVRFGPDVTWVDEIDYDFDESRKPEFVKAIKSYFPGLDETKLLPAYTGIRSKLAGPRARFTDFEIQFDADHGVPGLVNLMGIESPGLSACLAIAEFVQHNISR